MIDSVLIGWIAIAVQIVQPELEPAIRWRNGAAQVNLITPVDKLRIICELSAATREQPRKSSDPESARHVNAFDVSAAIVVVESGTASSGDVAGPEIQTACIRFRLVDEKICVMLPDEEPLIVDRVCRRWQ